MYGGFDTTTSNSVLPAAASKSDCSRVMRSITPCLSALRRATSSALEGEIHRRHLGSRQGMRNRNSDCTRTGPHVNDAWVCLPRLNRSRTASTKMLGFRTRDQNIRRDFEEQTGKFLLSSKVLHWFIRKTALEQALKLVCFLRGKRALGMREQSCWIAPEHVGQNQLSVASRILGSRRQSSAGCLQYITGACRHFTPQWLFQP